MNKNVAVLPEVKYTHVFNCILLMRIYTHAIVRATCGGQLNANRLQYLYLNNHRILETLKKLQALSFFCNTLR